MSWSLNITRVENGYEASYYEELEDGEERRVTNVFQEDLDVIDSEDECHVLLLNHIKDYFGFNGSKHDNKRIRAMLIPNDEVEVLGLVDIVFGDDAWKQCPYCESTIKE